MCLSSLLDEVRGIQGLFLSSCFVVLGVLFKAQTGGKDGSGKRSKAWLE